MYWTLELASHLEDAPWPASKDELIDFADLVTEMTMIKHPFRSGVKAQVGVEF